MVNKTKVAYGMVWYIGTLVGYGLMESFDQGLNIHSSKEMFFYTASETLFLISMAMTYFYSWQTYSADIGEVVDVQYTRVLQEVFSDFKAVIGVIMSTFVCRRVMEVVGKMEQIAGKGGHMASGQSKQDYDNIGYSEVAKFEDNFEDEDD